MEVGFLLRAGAEDGADPALPKSERRRGDALPLSELAVRPRWQGREGGGGTLWPCGEQACGDCGRRERWAGHGGWCEAAWTTTSTERGGGLAGVGWLSRHPAEWPSWGVGGEKLRGGATRPLPPPPIQGHCGELGPLSRQYLSLQTGRIVRPPRAAAAFLLPRATHPALCCGSVLPSQPYVSVRLCLLSSRRLKDPSPHQHHKLCRPTCEPTNCVPRFLRNIIRGCQQASRTLHCYLPIALSLTLSFLCSLVLID